MSMLWQVLVVVVDKMNVKLPYDTLHNPAVHESILLDNVFRQISQLNSAFGGMHWKQQDARFVILVTLAFDLILLAGNSCLFACFLLASSSSTRVVWQATSQNWNANRRRKCTTSDIHCRSVRSWRDHIYIRVAWQCRRQSVALAQHYVHNICHYKQFSSFTMTTKLYVVCWAIQNHSVAYGRCAWLLCVCSMLCCCLSLCVCVVRIIWYNRICHILQMRNCLAIFCILWMWIWYYLQHWCVQQRGEQAGLGWRVAGPRQWHGQKI